ncbi:MAG: LPS export ABC transporter periplasmic protein LptC [Bacillota bacterium]
MTLKNNKIYLVVILLLIIMGGFLWNQLKNQSEQNSEEEISEYQYQVADPQLVSYSDGNKRWDIESETITQPKTEDKEEKTKVILKKVKDGKLYSNEKLEYKVQADEIIYFEKSKNIELYGNVRLKQIAGDQIFADKLNWNDETKKLKTDSGVKVKMNDGDLSAQKMNLNLETKIIDFTDDVTMTFKVRGAQGDEE